MNAPVEKQTWERVLAYGVPSVLLCAVVVWALWHTPNFLYGMYANQDGTWAAWNATAIFRWGRFLDLGPFNPLSGMGSVFLPNLPWLNPGALALALPMQEDLRFLVSYLTYFAELFLASIFLYRRLGLSPIQASLVAQCYLVLFFPPFPAVTEALTWYSLAPVNAHLAAMANVFLGCFVRLGREPGCKENLRAAFCAVAAIVVGLYSAPITFLTYGPVYGLICMGFLLWQRGRTALLWRIGTLLAITLMLWGAGYVDYVRGSIGVSARALGTPSAFAAGARLLTFQYWRDASTQFSLCQAVQAGCWTPLIVKVYALAIFGALAVLCKSTWKEAAKVRLAAAMFLVCVCAIEFSANVHNLSLFGQWHALAPVYFVWSGHTFVALFAAMLILLPLELWLRRSKAGRAALLGYASAATAMLLVPGVALYLWTAKIAQNQPPAPSYKHAVPLLGKSSVREPQVGPVVRYLIDNARLAKRDLFRGYVVTNFGDPRGHLRQAMGYKGAGMSSGLYIEANPYLDQHYGNQFKEMDLWRFSIPTVEEYGQWVGTMLYVFLNGVFSRDIDELPALPAFARVYRVEIDPLAALGVRFLITDTRLDDTRLRLRAQQDAPDAGPIYLYEIAGANLANYSPARTVTVKTFRDAIDAVAAKGLGLKDVAYVFQDVPGEFRGARNAQMRMARDGFRVTVESDGQSLLVVPVQFSRCLRAEGDGASGVTLMRANGIQTLMRFSGKVDVMVRLDFGLFGSAGCRIEDSRDLERLKVVKRWIKP